MDNLYNVHIIFTIKLLARDFQCYSKHILSLADSLHQTFPTERHVQTPIKIIYLNQNYHAPSAQKLYQSLRRK